MCIKWKITIISDSFLSVLTCFLVSYFTYFKYLISLIHSQIVLIETSLIYFLNLMLLSAVDAKYVISTLDFHMCVLHYIYQSYNTKLLYLNKVDHIS